jgi:FtsZ-binding cell division protein ZapB
MKWQIILTAAVLSLGGLAYGQAAPNNAADESISAERVRWALAQMDARIAARQKEATTRPAKAAAPQDQADTIAELRAQVATLKKENARLRTELQDVDSRRLDAQRAMNEAVESARQAQLVAQRAMSTLPSMRGGYGWNYGAGLSPFVPVPGLPSPAPGVNIPGLR